MLTYTCDCFLDLHTEKFSKPDKDDQLILPDDGATYGGNVHLNFHQHNDAGRIQVNQWTGLPNSRTGFKLINWWNIGNNGAGESGNVIPMQDEIGADTKLTMSNTNMIENMDRIKSKVVVPNNSWNDESVGNGGIGIVLGSVEEDRNSGLLNGLIENLNKEKAHLKDRNIVQTDILGGGQNMGNKVDNESNITDSDVWTGGENFEENNDPHILHKGEHSVHGKNDEWTGTQPEVKLEGFISSGNIGSNVGLLNEDGSNIEGNKFNTDKKVLESNNGMTISQQISVYNCEKCKSAGNHEKRFTKKDNGNLVLFNVFVEGGTNCAEICNKPKEERTIIDGSKPEQWGPDASDIGTNTDWKTIPDMPFQVPPDTKLRISDSADPLVRPPGEVLPGNTNPDNLMPPRRMD